MATEKILVFVYGTLRPSLRAYKDMWTRLPQGEKIGTGTICGTLYKLTDLVPGVKLGGNSQVVGEVVAVTKAELDKFDTLEGHPRNYTRKLVDVRIKDEVIKAWCYEYQHLNERHKVVVDGDWTGTYLTAVGEIESWQRGSR